MAVIWHNQDKDTLIKRAGKFAMLRASMESDIDQSLRMLMRIVGITDGGVAGAVFSDGIVIDGVPYDTIVDAWPRMDCLTREWHLLQWLATEELYTTERRRWA